MIFKIICFIFTDLDQTEITFNPLKGSTREGDQVTLYCNATGNPPPTISWTRNGFPLKTSDNSRINFLEGKKQLTITNVSRTDSGKYRCVATSELGNVTSKAKSIDVQCKNTVVPMHKRLLSSSFRLI